LKAINDHFAIFFSIYLLDFFLKYLRFKNVSDNFIGMNSRQSFFKEYAKSGYMEKINPEF
jgi:hypothetical protein